MRLCFEQRVVSPDLRLICFQASIQLVPLQRPTGKILRTLHPTLVTALHQLERPTNQ